MGRTCACGLDNLSIVFIIMPDYHIYTCKIKELTLTDLHKAVFMSVICFFDPVGPKVQASRRKR
jgi:hypothetical protein